MSTYKGGVDNRRKRALKRLELQLAPHYEAVIKRNQTVKEKSKDPKEKNDMKTKAEDFPGILTPAQVTRMEKEIQTLKSRIEHPNF